MLQVGAQEGSNVGPSLRDDEVVHVEELGDAGERGVTIRVVGLTPGAKGDFLAGSPWDDCAGFIFTFEDHGRVERCGGSIGGESRGPDKLGFGLARAFAWIDWY